MKKYKLIFILLSFFLIKIYSYADNSCLLEFKAKNIYDDVTIDTYQDENNIGTLNVLKNGKRGIIDCNNNIILPIEYDFINRRNNYKDYLVKKDNEIIFIKNGKQIRTDFESAHFDYSLNDNYIIGTKNSKWGFFDITKEKYILPIIYDSIDHLYIEKNNGDFYLSIKKDDNYKIIKNGEEYIFDIDLKYVKTHNQFIIVQDNNYKYRLYDIKSPHKNKTVLKNFDFIYDDIRYVEKDTYSIIVKKNGKYGIIKYFIQTGQIIEVIPFIYDDIILKSETYTLAEKDDKWYLLNKNSLEFEPNLEFISILPDSNSYSLYYVRKENGETGVVYLHMGKYYSKEQVQKMNDTFDRRHPILTRIIVFPFAVMMWMGFK